MFFARYNPDTTLTAEQAAEILGVTPRRVRTLCRAGRIVGARKIGRDWIIPNPPSVVPARRGPKSERWEEHTMTNFEGYAISTGFLAGNLFGDMTWAEKPVDEDESAHKYAEMIEDALKRSFPGATVEVQYQLNASGALPVTLETSVTTPDGGIYRAGDFGEAAMEAERVDTICGEVWEAWDWVVYEEDQSNP